MQIETADAFDQRQRIAGIIEQYSVEGIHRTGTPVDVESANNLIAAINQVGAQAEVDQFEFQRIEVRDARFVLEGSELEGVPLYDCTYTGLDGVTGTIGPLGSSADIGVQMTLPFDSAPSALEILAARRSGQHQAIVVVTDNRLPEDGIALLNAEHFGTPFGPPVLQVANRHWPEIQSAMQHRAIGKMVAHAVYVPAQAVNIQARIPGVNPELPPLVVMTPRSGWWFNASERGGGIAAWLEIMRMFMNEQPDRDVIFTANTGHELGHTGLDHFLEQNKALVRQATWIHLGANFAARSGGNVRLQYSNDSLRELVTRLRGDLPVGVETPIGERPLGEARNIFDGGGEFVSLLGGNGLFHHPNDVWPDAIDLDLTTQWVSVMVKVAKALA
jgi:peptidoglycan/xylan/chitin deacetylase (PgdA/CDA1 family)